jgi:SAM-dependent MidA family methyltransferase
MIRTDGPITVERYMGLCNEHYYATRDPLGADGDFTTAPEISQMFGEIVGAALADCWLRAGAPLEASYAELGPGRGTLAADALRVLRKAGFSGEVHLIETSPALRAEQAQRVPDAQWHSDIADLPAIPMLLIANEFFDALPVRQWIADEERRVTLRAGMLAFNVKGAIREDSPAREEAARALASHLREHGGAALIVDYGHSPSGPGETLQAVRRHAFADVLTDPGEQDLTAHVDFEALTKAASVNQVMVSQVVAQGEWLERLGIGARAAALAIAHPDRAGALAEERKRLCDAAQMGKIFKVMAMHSRSWPPPAGFAA